MSAEVPTAPGYDRDAIIASITRYYELLSKMAAIKPKDIAYAPEGGRTDEDIPIEKLRRLGLNDRAVNFIRHVPVVCSVDRPVLQGTQTLVFLTMFSISMKTIGICSTIRVGRKCDQ